MEGKEKIKLYKKWWFWLCIVVALIVAIGILGGIVNVVKNLNNLVLTNNNSNNTTENEYTIVSEYDGLYSFEIISNNVIKNVAKGILEFDNGICTVKYVLVSEDKSNMYEYSQSGTYGKKSGKNNLYFTIIGRYDNKNTYECTPNNSNFECTLIDGYDFTGNTNKKLSLTHLESSDINTEYEKIKQQEQEIINQVKVQKEAEEKAKKEKEEKEFKASCKTYTYEQIARNPENFKGTNVKLTGEVVQVMTDSYSTNLRVNITKKGNYSTYYTDTIYVVYHPEVGEDKILEDDIITIYGTSQGDCSYTTVMGSTVTLPNILAKYIIINK